jgi:hypothetical protein
VKQGQATGAVEELGHGEGIGHRPQLEISDDAIFGAALRECLEDVELRFPAQR